MDLKLFALAALFHFSAGLPIAGFSSKYSVGQSYTYDYVTETLLNEAEVRKEKAHAYRDVGLKFAGEVTVTVVWNDNMNMLVKLAVANPSAVLESVSRKHVQRELNTIPKYPIFFQWSEGKVVAVYTAKDDSTLSINIKKGIVSLFQLVNVNKAREEVDASGTCYCTYVVNGEIIHKTKTNCKTEDSDTYFRNVNPLLELSKQFSSETVYKVKDEVLDSARSSERLVSRVEFVPSIATSVTVTQELKLKKTFNSGTKQKGRNIDDAIKKLAKSKRAWSLFSEV